MFRPQFMKFHKEERALYGDLAKKDIYMTHNGKYVGEDGKYPNHEPGKNHLIKKLVYRANTAAAPSALPVFNMANVQLTLEPWDTSHDYSVGLCFIEAPSFYLSGGDGYVTGVKFEEKSSPKAFSGLIFRGIQDYKYGGYTNKPVKNSDWEARFNSVKGKLATNIVDKSDTAVNDYSAISNTYGETYEDFNWHSSDTFSTNIEIQDASDILKLSMDIRTPTRCWTSKSYIRIPFPRKTPAHVPIIVKPKASLIRVNLNESQYAEIKSNSSDFKYYARGDYPDNAKEAGYSDFGKFTSKAYFSSSDYTSFRDTLPTTKYNIFSGKPVVKKTTFEAYPSEEDCRPKELAGGTYTYQNPDVSFIMPKWLEVSRKFLSELPADTNQYAGLSRHYPGEFTLKIKDNTDKKKLEVESVTNDSAEWNYTKYPEASYAFHLEYLTVL